MWHSWNAYRVTWHSWNAYRVTWHSLLNACHVTVLIKCLSCDVTLIKCLSSDTSCQMRVMWRGTPHEMLVMWHGWCEPNLFVIMYKYQYIPCVYIDELKHIIISLELTLKACQYFEKLCLFDAEPHQQVLHQVYVLGEVTRWRHYFVRYSAAAAATLENGTIFVVWSHCGPVVCGTHCLWKCVCALYVEHTVYESVCA
jgi:hypothetical protein